MDPITVGIIGIFFMLLLLFLGMPVALAMMIVGFLGITTLTSFDTAFPIMARTIYSNVANYPYMVVPLFVLMGSFGSVGGLVGDLYDAFEKWFRRVPGGLAAATIGASAAFAAVSGSSVATSAAMSRIAYPEMRKHNYSLRLISGTIAAGGTLGFLIPPSLAFVIYGMLTEQSIGRLLIAGIVPGLLLAIAFIILVIFMVIRKPEIAPVKAGAVSWRERFKALLKVWQILLVFMVVMGGIYLGWFSPAEAGAIGATMLLAIVVIKGKFTFTVLSAALQEAIRISTMVIFLMAGAYVFTYFLGLTRVPVEMTAMIAGLDVSPYIILGLILLVLLILGCFIDVVAMLVLTIPVMYPIIIELGFDPIFFGVICVLMMNAGLITPPLGLNLFTIKGCIEDCKIEEIYMGAIPFLIPILVVVVLITIFPQLVLYLATAIL